jgi:NADPH-dependent 2,4-dienoyl-CoA reductase/sulfur reductase-like enzyme/nitrite reductase/ring-hydroxylating ferredoxin subunit
MYAYLPTEKITTNLLKGVGIMEEREIRIAKTGDLQPGEMKEVSIGDQKILLVNLANKFYAVGCCCPHYGAPLVDGVLSGDYMICPWHNAVFHVQTGDLEEPPALDALPKYDVTIKGDDVIVSLPEKLRRSRTPAMVTYDPQSDKRTFVILGAGAAGNAAAQTLREDGYQGRILMITYEDRLPYDRPNLSKAYLQGTASAEWMPLRSEKFYQKYGIELLRQKKVTKVDVPTRAITFEDGDNLTADALLLAPGSVPRVLDIPGSNLNNIFTLRSYTDADKVIAACQQASRVAVIGASFIGIETAVSLSQRDLQVTVIAPETTPFERVFGKGIGTLIQKVHQDNGITFKLGTTVTKFEGSEKVEAVLLNNGEKVEADLVVVGIGVKPNTSFLQGITLQPDGSVKVDASFHAAEDVYAAGDIAMFPDWRTGEDIRIEHWRTAEQQGRVAAHNMAGKQAMYDSVPFFWTKQGELNIKYVGHVQEWDDLIIQGDLAAQNCLALYVKQDQVLAAAGINRGKEIGAIQELMRLKKMSGPEELRQGLVDFLALLKS